MRTKLMNVLVIAMALYGLRPAVALADSEPEVPPPPPAAAAGDPAAAMLPALAFPINDEDPASQVPTKEQANNAPLDMGYWVMAVSDRAEAAKKRGDHRTAAKYYMALTVAVPDQAVAFSKLCRSLEAAGDAPGALEACRATLAKPGATVDDHARLVRLLLGQASKLGDADLADIDAIASHIEREVPENKGRLLANQLRCETALRLSDAKRLEACVGALTKLAPNEPQTHTFAWALAMQNKDWDTAQQVVDSARKAGLPAAAIAQMQTGLRE